MSCRMSSCLDPACHRLSQQLQGLIDADHARFATLPLPHTFTQAEVASVKELVKVCSQGAAVVMDRHLIALNRLWCAYEMWAFVNYVGIGAIKVWVCGGGCST